MMGLHRTGAGEYHGFGSPVWSMRRAALLVVGLSAALGLASPPAHGDLLADAQERDLRASLAGTWTAAKRGGMELTLGSDGYFLFDGVKGNYEVEGSSLVMRQDEEETRYIVKLEGKKLTLSGDSLSGPIILYRKALALEWLSLFTAESVKGKLLRILQILLIAVAARLVIGGMRWLSHFFIYSSWGPLRYLYPQSKSRIRTIHSLGLNVLKYIVYLLAVGFILSELGINYTAYFVSLSFVGLAIGFGSQGLVQDMVTGLFVLFEGQFEVGDMVEISGQVGVVTDFGLRMTKLRNYAGQEVFIPNRNISTVGRFVRGAQQVWVDVHLTDKASSEQGIGLLGQIGKEVAEQFEGVMVKSPEVSGPRSLAAGGQFIRLATAIWPKEQWVIDQQLLPRIRESFKQAGVEIAADRVVVFYHAREKVPLSPPRLIPRRRRPQKT